MTTEPAADGESAGDDEPAADREGTADGAYTVTLDRGACEGIFACLVRDERFVEATDGLATIEEGGGTGGDRPAVTDGGTVTARFEDDRLDAARQAAAACPVDAIEVAVEGTAQEGNDE